MIHIIFCRRISKKDDMKKFDHAVDNVLEYFDLSR